MEGMAMKLFGGVSSFTNKLNQNIDPKNADLAQTLIYHFLNDETKDANGTDNNNDIVKLLKTLPEDFILSSPFQPILDASKAVEQKRPGVLKKLLNALVDTVKLQGVEGTVTKFGGILKKEAIGVDIPAVLQNVRSVLEPGTVDDLIGLLLPLVKASPVGVSKPLVERAQRALLKFPDSDTTRASVLALKAVINDFLNLASVVGRHDSIEVSNVQTSANQHETPAAPSSPTAAHTAGATDRLGSRSRSRSRNRMRLNEATERQS